MQELCALCRFFNFLAKCKKRECWKESRLWGSVRIYKMSLNKCIWKDSKRNNDYDALENASLSLSSSSSLQLSTVSNDLRECLNGCFIVELIYILKNAFLLFLLFYTNFLLSLFIIAERLGGMGENRVCIKVKLNLRKYLKLQPCWWVGEYTWE